MIVKYIFKISNGYFTEFHFVVSFMRYHCLKQRMFVTNVATHPSTSAWIFSLQRNLRELMLYKWKGFSVSSNSYFTEFYFVS
jgi:hypothetical protein